MKIAKKVLAVVMAIAMIACCTAMAFAAEQKALIKASEVKDGAFAASFAVVDYAELKAKDWSVKYDAKVLSVVGEPALDAALAPILMAGKLMGAFNTLKVTEDNALEAGEILAGIAFAETLGKAEETTIFSVNFKVVDEAATKTTIELVEEGKVIATLTVTLKDEIVVPETTTEAPAETTTEEAPSNDAPTTKPGKDDNGGKTGDTGALAIAAGVVALAGAAFVVSKKKR